MHGLQVFDKDGNITLDTNDRITKVLGTLDTRTTNFVTSDEIKDAYRKGNELWAIPIEIFFPNGFMGGSDICTKSLYLGQTNEIGIHVRTSGGNYSVAIDALYLYGLY